ncbi:phage antirepressor KilAC domain-containing protein [Porcincola intestinalis]|nr:phage antirepressor KilAC domain-containing protein [Porcincola intestinalis]MCI6767633.1 phage antirepressor KilAC domain-containing protein [Lachnospiraceae bacterium]MDD7060507.1 phage antirepressor KilAC domain-containing protein [Porcincola intestinalis]MDY5282528.1 phage antirepressor KilAC domain-containing protein [Porcincola intestinalis]
MDDLIKVNFAEEYPTVSARELYVGLGIKTQFRSWFPRMCSYGFTEHVDYKRLYQKRSTLGGMQTMVDYQISIDMAKHICMIQRNEKGKLYRQYFLELERTWNSPEKVMARALQLANAQVKELSWQCSRLDGQIQEQKKQIASLRPKAVYLDMILHSPSLVLTTQIAKDYGISAIRLNRLLHEWGIQYKRREQWILYAQYQGQGYTCSTSVEIRRSDGRLEVKYQTEWTQKGRAFLYQLLKSKGYLPVVEQQMGIMETAGANLLLAFSVSGGHGEEVKEAHAGGSE